jgi:hypothetical protein
VIVTLSRVKGTLFVDYVRMLRAQKATDWSRHLMPEDLSYLVLRIEPDRWYPMGTFERMGLAILKELSPDLATIRAWGRAQVDWLCRTQAELVAYGDARDTLMRFRVLRASFFDYEALTIAELTDGDATLFISYGMSARAEEAASWQTLGFFERLLEVAGATNVQGWFENRSWTSEGRTRIRIHWEGAHLG